MATKSIKTTAKSAKTTAPKVARASKSKSASKNEVTRVPQQLSQLTHDSIAVRAYELFCTRGYEHGHDVEDWLAAERELSTELALTTEPS
jgi:hypothetical protein